MPTLDHLLSVRALKAVNSFYCRAFHHLDVTAPPRLPATGPAILVCNHTSGLDPFLIQAVCPRVITWMMAREFYDMPVASAIFRHIGAIPVSRGARDSTATRAAIRALHEGHVLGIFPEGRIEAERKLMPFQTGVALMAIKTSVPVYPACLDGTQRGKPMLQAFLDANDVQLAFGGEPIALDRTSTAKEALAESTARIQAAVQDLMVNIRAR